MRADHPDAAKEARRERQREREDLLDRLSLATLRQITNAMETSEGGKVTAAAINVARQVLSDNGVTVESLRHHTGDRLGSLARELPTFPDEDAASPPFVPLAPGAGDDDE